MLSTLTKQAKKWQTSVAGLATGSAGVSPNLKGEPKRQLFSKFTALGTVIVSILGIGVTGNLGAEVLKQLKNGSVESRAKKAFKNTIDVGFPHKTKQEYVERGFEDDLFSEFTSAMNRVSIIPAPPGAGKTVVVQNLAKTLLERKKVSGVCYVGNYNSLKRDGNIMAWLLGQMDIEMDEKRNVETKNGNVETIKVSCVTKAVPRDSDSKYLLILDHFEDLVEKSNDTQQFITSLAQECTFSNVHCIICVKDTLQLNSVMSWNKNTKIRTFQTRITMPESVVKTKFFPEIILWEKPNEKRFSDEILTIAAKSLNPGFVLDVVSTSNPDIDAIKFQAKQKYADWEEMSRVMKKFV